MDISVLFLWMCSKESVAILFDYLADLLASQIRKFEDFTKNLDGGFYDAVSDKFKECFKLEFVTLNNIDEMKK